jgi:hypothetical protein
MVKVKRSETREAYDLITREEAKAGCGIPEPETAHPDDEEFDRLVHRCSSLIAEWCNRDFEFSTYIDKFSSDGYREDLRVKNPPIATADPTAQVWVDYDHEWGDDTELDINEDYEIDYERGVIFFYTPIEQGILHIKVSYKGGYESIPDGLKAACVHLVAYLYHKSNEQSHDLTNINSPGWSLGLRTNLPEEIWMMISPWVVD